MQEFFCQVRVATLHFTKAKAKSLALQESL